MWSKHSFFDSTLFGHGDADLVHIEGTYSWELFSLHLYLFIDVYAFRCCCCCCFLEQSRYAKWLVTYNTPCITSHSTATTSFSSLLGIRHESKPIAANSVKRYRCLRRVLPFKRSRSRSNGRTFAECIPHTSWDAIIKLFHKTIPFNRQIELQLTYPITLFGRAKIAISCIIYRLLVSILWFSIYCNKFYKLNKFGWKMRAYV